MKQSSWLSGLSVALILIALVAATAGLFTTGGSGSFEFTTLHGETVDIYGQGLYQNDTAFRAPILRGGDVITLFLAIPVFLIALLRYRAGSLSGGLLVTGLLSYFLYNGVSLAFGAAYNRLFLLYVAYFSVSLFAFVLACRLVDIRALAERLHPGVPRRGMAIFLFITGLSVFVWLPENIAALVSGSVPPGLDSYTTDITAAIDIGVIPPMAYLSGFLLLRRNPFGYLFGPILLTLNAFIGAVVVGQTVVQTLDGITLTPAQYVAFVGIFALSSAFASWLLIRFHRSLPRDNAL